MITPEDFKERMDGIVAEYYAIKDDEELCHIKMDDLMCDVLRELGYGEGIDVFDSVKKWYA